MTRAAAQNPPLKTGGTPNYRRNSVIQLLSSYGILALVFVQGFAFTPIYLKYIGVSLYGAWLGMNNMITWVSLVDPGIARIAGQRISYFVGRGETRSGVAAYLSSVMLATVLTVIPLSLLFVARFAPGFFDISTTERASLEIACMWSLLAYATVLIEAAFSSIHRGMQRAALSGGLSFFTQLVSLISVYVLLVHMGLGVSAVPMGIVIRNLLTIFLGVTALLILDGVRSLRDGFPSLATIKSEWVCYRAGIPFGISQALRNQTVYFFSAVFLSPQAATLLYATRQVLSPLPQMIERTAMAPAVSLAHLAGLGNHSRMRAIYHRVTDLCAFIVFIAVGGIISLNSTFVRVWVGPELFGGVFLTVLLSASVALSMSVTSRCELMLALGATSEIAWARFKEGFLRGILQLALILLIGLPGLPLGELIAAAFVRAFVLPKLEARYFAEPLESFQWQTAREFFKVGGAVALGLAGYWIATAAGIAATWNAFAVAFAVTAVFFSGVAAMLYRDTFLFLFRRFTFKKP